MGGKKIRVKELRVKMKLHIYIYIYFRSNQLARGVGFAQNEQEVDGYHSI